MTTAAVWIAIVLSALSLLSTLLTGMLDRRRADRDKAQAERDKDLKEALDTVRQTQEARGAVLVRTLESLESKVDEVVATQRGMSDDISVLKATQAVHEDRFARPTMSAGSRK